MQPRIYKYLLIILAVIFWASSFIASKFALQEISPAVIVSLRLLIATAFLLIAVLCSKNSFKINLKSHGSIFILALISVFHLWIQLTGLKFTTAANSGWIVGTAPIFIALLGAVFFREKITYLKAAGTFTALFGLVLLISKGDFSSLSFFEKKGDLFILLSAFIWGVYSIANKKISLNYSPLMTIFYLFLMMAIIITPFNLTEESVNSVINLSSTGWAAVLFLGLFCSGAAYVIWAYALRDMESARVGSFLYLEPFFTVIAAWLFLNESITLLMIISGIIITTGVIMVNREN